MLGEIKAPIEHNDFRGLKHYIAKHNEYSSWEAARYLRLIGRDDCPQSSAEWDNLTDRQKKKYRNLGKWWFAPAYFAATYFLKKGFLDGAVGFHFALMFRGAWRRQDRMHGRPEQTIYFYQIRLKIKAAEGA